MSVISLITERQKRAKPTHREREHKYYCLRCDAGEFSMWASGAIHCVNCGALMKNLAVVMDQAPA